MGHSLRYERTISSVLEDTRRELRGEEPEEDYEIHEEDLLDRPLFRPRIRVLGRTVSSPQQQWGKAARSID